jgi:hypothetical protein
VHACPHSSDPRFSFLASKTVNIVTPKDLVENIQQGKAKAEAYAKAYLKRSVNLELPSLEWKSSRSIW